MEWYLGIDETVAWLKNFGLWAVLVSLLLNILISVLGVVPSIFLSGANAVVFGLVPGFLLSLLGETLGAAVSFWLFRLGFSKVKRLKTDRWRWLNSFNGSSRKKQALLLLIARLAPFVPSGLITAVTAISKMKFIDFMIVSFLGKSPSIVIETIIGHDIVRANDNLPRLVISLLLVSLFFFLFKKKKICLKKDSAAEPID